VYSDNLIKLKKMIKDITDLNVYQESLRLLPKLFTKIGDLKELSDFPDPLAF